MDKSPDVHISALGEANSLLSIAKEMDLPTVGINDHVLNNADDIAAYLELSKDVYVGDNEIKAACIMRPLL